MNTCILCGGRRRRGNCALKHKIEKSPEPVFKPQKVRVYRKGGGYRVTTNRIKRPPKGTAKWLKELRENGK